jgi:hypothetical protein
VTIVRIDEDKTLIREQKSNAVVADDLKSLQDYERQKAKALQQLDKDNRINSLTDQVEHLTQLVHLLLEKQNGNNPST